MLKTLKTVVLATPLVGTSAKFLYYKLTGRKIVKFERSDQYWEDRYQVGGTSGSGSYGRLAKFKADFLNQFVSENNISSVVEFGCGDGAQLELSEYPSYIGFDVSLTAVEMCRQKLVRKPNYAFELVGSNAFNAFKKVDAALSLDVIYHLVEDEVFHTYMTKLFQSAESFVVIFAYDVDKTYAAKHERGRNFSAWIEHHAPGWRLLTQVKNRYPYDASDPDNTSQSDFFVFTQKD